MPTARLFDIQRFCIQDGPGIRTGIFFKGCPLRCIWCHNPESLLSQDDFVYRANKCVGCGACVPACRYGVHTFSNGEHMVDYGRCVKCGDCVDVCCYGAVSLIGRTVTVEELLHEIETDLPYYGADGGVTLTGGEPMLQHEFDLAPENRTSYNVRKERKRLTKELKEDGKKELHSRANHRQAAGSRTALQPGENDRRGL